MKRKYILATILLVSWSLNAFALCEFSKNMQQNPLNYQIPSTLSIPRDSPNGTVIFQAEVTPGVINSSYYCSTSYSMGIKNNVGATTPAHELFPIGDTGIAWKLHSFTANRYLRGYIDPDFILAAGGYGFGTARYRLELVKVNDVAGGAVIPSGVLGYLQAGELSALSIQTNGASVLAASCETPNIDVRMGTFTLSDIGIAQGSISDPVAFGIKLNNCPVGINKITYRFTRVGETAGYKNGVIRLNSSSTAKGIGIQIKHSDGSPAVIDGATQKIYDGYDSKGGNFEIPMTAAYIHIDNEYLKPGTANAELKFTIEYL